MVEKIRDEFRDLTGRDSHRNNQVCNLERRTVIPRPQLLDRSAPVVLDLHSADLTDTIMEQGKTISDSWIRL